MLRPTEPRATFATVPAAHETPNPIGRALTDRAMPSDVLNARDPLAVMLGRSNEQAIDRLNADLGDEHREPGEHRYDPSVDRCYTDGDGVRVHGAACRGSRGR